MDYFNHIVTRLSWNELYLLGVLRDKEANAGFKAMKGGELRNACGLSDANFRKVINRLTALSFVESDTSDREFKYYLTEFGYEALSLALEKGLNPKKSEED